jgi:hypothetical protein
VKVKWWALGHVGKGFLFFSFLEQLAS